jgi:hypothetical protein
MPSARPRAQGVVVAGQFHCLAFAADEFDCREVKAVEGAHRVAYVYEVPDASTFRYGVFNMVEAVDLAADSAPLHHSRACTRFHTSY